MKVVHITTVHKTFDNRIYHKECTSLHNAGHLVSIMACASTEVPDGLNVNVVELKKYTNRKKHFIRTSVLQVIRIAKKINADVYHIHDPELLVSGLWLRFLGFKVVYDVHENNPASILSKPYLSGSIKPKLISYLFDKFEIFAAKRMSAIVTATDDIAIRFKKFNPVVVRNFPIAPDFSKIDLPKKSKDYPVVIFVGGMTRIRGIRELILAFNRLVGVKLWLLGTFESTEFEEECKALPGWENVEYLGSVKPQRIYGFIKMADIGVVTYLPYPNHVTALPTKPFEYMAGGLPMLMSNFEYWQSLFGEIAHFVDPSNSINIAEEIQKMLDDKNNLKRIRMRSLELINEKYSWQKEKNQLLDLYEKLEVN